MERDKAVTRLRRLVGHDLRPLADRYKVTVWKAGRKHKGWAGNTLEMYLGLPANSNPMADFFSWDLKLVSLRHDAKGALRVKESMAIDMINPAEVLSDRFEDSHLYDKFRQLVVVARIWESDDDARSTVQSVVPFTLADGALFDAVKADYETIRAALRRGGPGALHGGLGLLVQPRSKGAGGGSTGKAFYARASFVARMLEQK